MLDASRTDTAHIKSGTQDRKERPFDAGVMLKQFRTGIPVSDLARLAEQTPVNTFVTVSIAVMIAAFILLDSQQPGIVLWMLAQVSLSTLVSWRARPAAIDVTRDDGRLSRSGLARAVGWAGFSGVLWGALTLFMPASSPEARIAIILTIGGMAAGASTTLAAVPQAAIAFIAACAFALALHFLAQATALGLMVALSTVVFAAAMIGSTRVVYLSLRRQLDAERRSEQFRAAVLQHRISSTVSDERPVNDILADCVREICLYSGWPAGFAFLPASQSSSPKQPLNTFWRLQSNCSFGNTDLLETRPAKSACQSLVERVSESARPAWFRVSPSRQNVSRSRARRLFQKRQSHAAEPRSPVLIAMPAVVGKKVAAIVVFLSREPRTPDRERVELLAAIGAHLGNTVECHRVIRQLRETQARAQREQHRAREYLDIAGSIIIAIGKDERITLLNRAGASVLDCPVGEAIGQNWFDHFVPVDGREARRAKFRRWMSGEEHLDAAYEVKLQSRNGAQPLVRAQMTLLHDDAGNITGLLASGQDITEQRSTEAQLMQAQKMETVGQLASGIAHDFNNALMAARGNLELLQQTTALDAAAASFVANSTSALDSAAELTNRLLSFSRKSILLSKPLRLDAVVESIMQIVGKTFGRNIHVTINSAPDLWLADADATQLEASVLNLAINARDAMPDGGELNIRLENVCLDERQADDIGLAAGNYVSVAVSDTGIGMTRYTLERAFEPFYSAKPERHGSGLGLSMVYGFARQSNGTVTLSSTPGEGTVATIYLPRSHSRPQAPGGVSGDTAVTTRRRSPGACVETATHPESTVSR